MRFVLGIGVGLAIGVIWPDSDEIILRGIFETAQWIADLTDTRPWTVGDMTIGGTQ